MLTVMFLAAWAILLLAPETPISRAIHRALVVWPAEKLSRVRGGHVLLFALLASVAAVVWWLLADDGLQMLRMGAPEIAAFVTSIEVSAYLDVLAAVIVSASTLRLQALRGIVVRGWMRLRPRARAPRSRRQRAERPANDDEDRPVVIYLAA